MTVSGFRCRIPRSGHSQSFTSRILALGVSEACPSSNAAQRHLHGGTGAHFWGVFLPGTTKSSSAWFLGPVPVFKFARSLNPAQDGGSVVAETLWLLCAWADLMYLELSSCPTGLIEPQNDFVWPRCSKSDPLAVQSPSFSSSSPSRFMCLHPTRTMTEAPKCCLAILQYQSFL